MINKIFCKILIQTTTQTNHKVKSNIRADVETVTITIKIQKNTSRHLQLERAQVSNSVTEHCVPHNVVWFVLGMFKTLSNYEVGPRK